MEKCLFCQIAKKEVPANLLYEDKEIIAFLDINPKAPIHILIIPKKHISSLKEVKKEDQTLLGKMLFVANQIAKDKKISDKGFRLVINTGKESGQIVEHLHLHLLGGRVLGSIA